MLLFKSRIYRFYSVVAVSCRQPVVFLRSMQPTIQFVISLVRLGKILTVTVRNTLTYFEQKS